MAVDARVDDFAEPVHPDFGSRHRLAHLLRGVGSRLALPGAAEGARLGGGPSANPSA